MEREALSEILEAATGREHVATTAGVSYEGFRVWRKVAVLGEYAVTLDREGNVARSISFGGGFTNAGIPAVDTGFTFWFDVPELAFERDETQSVAVRIANGFGGEAGLDTSSSGFEIAYSAASYVGITLTVDTRDFIDLIRNNSGSMSSIFDRFIIRQILGGVDYGAYAKYSVQVDQSFGALGVVCGRGRNPTLS